MTKTELIEFADIINEYFFNYNIFDCNTQLDKIRLHIKKEVDGRNHLITDIYFSKKIIAFNSSYEGNSLFQLLAEFDYSKSSIKLKKDLNDDKLLESISKKELMKELQEVYSRESRGLIDKQINRIKEASECIDEIEKKAKEVEEICG
jgi:hypothetical protein